MRTGAIKRLKMKQRKKNQREIVRDKERERNSNRNDDSDEEIHYVTKGISASILSEVRFQQAVIDSEHSTNEAVRAVH